jgi:hypothetical protein
VLIVLAVGNGAGRRLETGHETVGCAARARENLRLKHEGVVLRGKLLRDPTLGQTRQIPIGRTEEEIKESGQFQKKRRGVQGLVITHVPHLPSFVVVGYARIQVQKDPFQSAKLRT